MVTGSKTVGRITEFYTKFDPNAASPAPELEDIMAHAALEAARAVNQTNREKTTG